MRGNSHVRFLGGKRRGNPPDPADDREDTLFGFTILNGDMENTEWGYISLSEITGIPIMNIDYHFEEQSIEAARYLQYPHHFSKPASLEK
jgi:hypothetical protein